MRAPGVASVPSHAPDPPTPRAVLIGPGALPGTEKNYNPRNMWVYSAVKPPAVADNITSVSQIREVRGTQFHQ